MRLESAQDQNSGSGFARRITRSIKSWESRNLTARSGKSGGGRDGRMADVIEELVLRVCEPIMIDEENLCICIVTLYPTQDGIDNIILG